MDYQKIMQRYLDSNKRKKSVFVRMYYIEHRPPQDIMNELYIDSRSSYHKLRKSVARDIINKHHKDSVDYDQLVKDYNNKNNLKRAYFVQYFFIFKRSKEKIIKDLLLWWDEEFYRIQNNIIQDIAKKKWILVKEYNKNAT